MATNPATITGLPPGFVLDQTPEPTPVPIIPRTPAPQTPAQAQKDVADAGTAQNNEQISKFKVTQEQRTTQQQKAQQDMNTEGLGELISSVERAKSLVNDWSTGAAGWALKQMPTATDAGKLDSVINQEIRGNIFLNRVNQMKEENPSPTGGTGIGRIMQAEIPMITGALGTLDPTHLGTQGTLDSLNQIEYRALRSKAILDGKNPDDPAVAKQYGIDKIAALLPAPKGPGTPPPSGDGTDNNPPPPGVSSLNPSQKQAYDAFLAANPNPTGQQVGAFLTKLTGQQVTNGDDIAKAIAQGRGASTTVENKTEEQKVADTIANENKVGVDQEDPATRVLVHGATLGLSDEAAGIGNALSNVVTSPFTGKFDPVGAYKLGRDVEQQRVNDAQNQLGYAGTGLEIAGGLAAGNPESAADAAATTIRNLVARGAKAGGAYGVISGYGQGRGLDSSLVGAGVGGVTGAAIGALGGRFLGGKTPPPDAGGGPAPGDIAQALQAEGIPAARPVADPALRAKMAYLETTRGGNAPVQQGLALTRQSIADKVAGLTGDGSASAPGVAGQAIQDAGSRTLQDAKEAAQGVYKQAEASAGETPITPTLALNKLDSYIDKLSRNPNTNAGLVSYLKDIRGDLSGVPEGGPVPTGLLDQNGAPILKPGAPAQPKTLADLRDIMTGANDKINFQNLQKTRAEGIMFDVGKSLNQDISGTLQQANPAALELYNKADGMWSDMSNLRRQVVSRLIGPADNPLSGEQTMSRVTQMMSSKGDLGRFNRVMNMMTPSEKADFQASLWENIGQRSPEEGWTPGQFLAQTKNMQPDALKAVFGPDGAQSIQNLRVASRGLLDAQGSLNNSRSGFVANFKDFLGSILTLKHTGAAGAGYAVAGVPGAIVGAGVGEGAQRVFNGLSAKALMNPDVSSWIRKVATVKTTQQAQALIGKLNGIAAANANISGEVTGLRDMLTKAINDNLPRAGNVAASPNSGPNQQQ